MSGFYRKSVNNSDKKLSGESAKELNKKMPNGYLETIQKGISAVRTFRSGFSYGDGSREEQIARLKKEIESADAIVIGAGAGLSTAAGFTYSGERFKKYFGDFAERFGIQDMYSGGFYPFPDEETRWAWWARHIYYNRYIDAFGIRTILSSQQMWTISSRERALTRSGCSIRRATTDCSKA